MKSMLHLPIASLRTEMWKTLEGGEAAALPELALRAPTTAKEAEVLPSPGQGAASWSHSWPEGRTQGTLTRS